MEKYSELYIINYNYKFKNLYVKHKPKIYKFLNILRDNLRTAEYDDSMDGWVGCAEIPSPVFWVSPSSPKERSLKRGHSQIQERKDGGLALDDLH